MPDDLSQLVVNLEGVVYTLTQKLDTLIKAVERLSDLLQEQIKNDISTRQLIESRDDQLQNLLGAGKKKQGSMWEKGQLNDS